MARRKAFDAAEEVAQEEPQIGEGIETAIAKAEDALTDTEERKECPYCKKLFKRLDGHIANKHADEVKAKEKKNERVEEIIEAVKQRLGMASVDLVKNLCSMISRHTFEYPSKEFQTATASLHSLIIEYCIEKWGPGQDKGIIIITLTAVLQWNEFATFNYGKYRDSRAAGERENLAYQGTHEKKAKAVAA